MALSFPTSPAAGDQYIAPNGITYTWNATLSTWTSTGVSGAGGGGGGVTSVTGTAPIVSSGGATPAISLQTSGVAAGSYTLSNITVDTFGRVTSASSGTAPGNGTIQVNQGGVSKGSFTVNQTGNTTLNLDAGGVGGNVQAWVNFNAAANPPTIRASGNVSSITDISQGQFTINFASAFPDANYIVAGSGSVRDSTDDANVQYVAPNRLSTATYTSSACQITISGLGFFNDCNFTGVLFIR